MMFGYATNETDNYMRFVGIAHSLLRELAAIRKEGKTMTYLRLMQNTSNNRVR